MKTAIIKFYANRSGVVNMWGYYFDENNSIHDFDTKKIAGWENFDDLIAYADDLIEEIDPGAFGYDHDIINSHEGSEFTREYNWF